MYIWEVMSFWTDALKIFNLRWKKNFTKHWQTFLKSCSLWVLKSKGTIQFTWSSSWGWNTYVGSEPVLGTRTVEMNKKGGQWADSPWGRQTVEIHTCFSKKEVQWWWYMERRCPSRIWRQNQNWVEDIQKTLQSINIEICPDWQVEVISPLWPCGPR